MMDELNFPCKFHNPFQVPKILALGVFRSHFCGSNQASSTYDDRTLLGSLTLFNLGIAVRVGRPLLTSTLVLFVVI